MTARTGQEWPIRYLGRILANGNVPHALCFTGEDGLGKENVALGFAMACNCEGAPALSTSRSLPGRREAAAGPLTAPVPAGFFGQGLPCGVCVPCRKIHSGHHPDILRVKPAGVWTRIGQIRSLLDTLALKPSEGKVRVVILSQAGTLNAEAGNALLKALEEPPDRTIFLLLAVQKSDLLPTISSRCQEVRFVPLSTGNIAECLVEREGVDRSAAGVVAAWANGSLDRARRIMERSGLRRRDWLVDALAAVEARPLLGMALAELLAAGKEDLEQDLECLQLWLRDLLVYPFAPERLVNKDRTDKIAALSARREPMEWMGRFRAVEAARRSLNKNINRRLALEVMMERLSGRW